MGITRHTSSLSSLSFSIFVVSGYTTLVFLG